MLVYNNCLYYAQHITSVSCFLNHNSNGPPTEAPNIVFVFFHVLPLLNLRMLKNTTKESQCFNFPRMKTELVSYSNRASSFVFFSFWLYMLTTYSRYLWRHPPATDFLTYRTFDQQTQSASGIFKTMVIF